MQLRLEYSQGALHRLTSKGFGEFDLPTSACTHPARRKRSNPDCAELNPMPTG